MSDKIWCSHIIWNEEAGYWELAGARVFQAVWDICPVKGCHKERPKEPMKLAEILYNSWAKNHGGNLWEKQFSKESDYVTSGFIAESKAAVDAVCEAIDEILPGKPMPFHVKVTEFNSELIQAIKQAIRERLL